LPNLLLKEVLREQELKRKLSAILSADAKGYSRLMGEDEAGTVRTIDQYKKIRPDLIRQHGGRTAGSPKSYLPAEAPSEVEALQDW
jgi:adenylate cyclase